MDWTMAVEAMRAGHSVRRQEWFLDGVLLDVENGVPVYLDRGREGMRLMAAWTDEQRPVTVFCGARSGVLFVPDDAEMAADDWVVVDERGKPLEAA